MRLNTKKNTRTRKPVDGRSSDISKTNFIFRNNNNNKNIGADKIFYLNYFHLVLNCRCFRSVYFSRHL